MYGSNLSDMWIRHHRKWRTSLFVPDADTGGPRASELQPYMMTRVVPQDDELTTSDGWDEVDRICSIIGKATLYSLKT